MSRDGARVVVDASAMAAWIFGEPNGAGVQRQMAGAAVFAPHLLKSELANIACTKARRHPAQTGALMTTLQMVLADGAITWCDVDPVDVALVAIDTGLTAYDASYLWLAGDLGADLLTLDRELMQAGS